MGKRAVLRAFWAAAAAGAVACGAATAPIIGAEVAAPTCADALASGPDAHPGCGFASALVQCSPTEVCINDDPTTCNGSTGCHDVCSPDGEYAVACDQRGGAATQPPAGCQQMFVAASGTLYYCCPCNP